MSEYNDIDTSTAEEKAKRDAEEIARMVMNLISQRVADKVKTMKKATVVQVGEMHGGKAFAVINKISVTLTAHPLQSLKPGDSVVVVPVSDTEYYIVGKIT